LIEMPSDHYRDREMLELLKSIAAGIFARHGVDFTTASRAGGWSNITWLAGGLALRLSTRQGNARIQREAKLAAILPPGEGPLEQWHPYRCLASLADGHSGYLAPILAS